ncbi:MAG: LCP family protein [Solirubrobacterales bacterium]|nr:LCP family protein [Solirubrobacterales bacterium]
MSDDRPPRVGLRMLLRALAGAVAIVVLTAGAVATAGLMAVDDLVTKIKRNPAIEVPEPLPEAPPGKPQTIMLIGSDRRYGAAKGDARSDTIMLLRLDSKQDVTALLSIPRDLKVDIPGHGTDKINAAYSIGGAALTAKTVSALLDIEIHHIVNANFKGFRRAVDAVDCVYTDVDRRYYHSNAGLPQSQHYAEIDLQPGYQRLCGQKALDYVRVRHADSDLVRGARQQDFLRAAKDQISTSSLIDNRGRLIDIFSEATQVDRGLQDSGELIKLLKLGIFSAGHPVRQIPFPAEFAGDPETGQFVVATDEGIRKTRWRFLHATPPAQPRKARPLTRKAKKGATATVRLRDARRKGEDLVAPMVARKNLGFPVYFPARLSPEGYYTTIRPSPRAYTIRDRAGGKHRAYRLVVVENELEGQYYGIQGTTWRTPPALAHPTGRTKVRGRTLLLYRDGKRLRYVAWKRKDAVYWVSNSLSLSLTNAQMTGIAGSLVRFRP